ncbi:hypothetical protein WR25_23827 [Diploscapter pachys]|uniref:Tyrosinase copper-binding domain-containing protein n=1 Tax=Diploscapter pachys TaxID=2018661 RepID=A0A2A2J8D8_9BILA|nr:hypothetical protein WR25_23827 [Diploscapter pachys]
MKNYTMPWFRIPRKNQKKVGIYNVADSGFGIHFIPYNDEFIPADWSEEEYQYLPCMSKECLCPFFMGKWINESCIVGPGIELKRAHRQEIRTLSDEKFKRWTKMLNELKATGKYTRMARHHKYSGVHSGPAFLLWHREFIKRCEIVFRKHMPIEDVNMGIPYWDSSLDWPLPTPSDSIFFSDIFVGEVDDEGLVKNGPFHNWTSIEGRPQILRQFNKSKDGELLNDARIKWLINNPDFNMIYGASMPIENCSITLPNDPRMFEHSHNYVHFYVNGDMSRGYSASNDIIFYLHHSMIDWILEHWRQNMQTREERESVYPASDPYCFPKWHFADNPMPMLQPFMNKDALSNGYADEIFEYTERPSCSRDNADCGSK